MADIDEFLQQVLADQSELDADPTPQTPAYALLSAGRFEEAEAVARQAVSDLEPNFVELVNNLVSRNNLNVLGAMRRAGPSTSIGSVP